MYFHTYVLYTCVGVYCKHVKEKMHQKSLHRQLLWTLCWFLLTPYLLSVHHFLTLLC